MKIPIGYIRINEGRRKLDGNKVNELAESIKDIGLINPITVKHDGQLGRYVLVAGNHRLEAYKQLGLDTINANIIAGDNLMMELIEIDENIIRNELHFTDRADLLIRRKQIYEEMYPETKREATLKQNRNETISERTKPSFVKDTAEKTGQSERTVEIELQIGRNLEPQEKQIIKEKSINKTEAINLARMQPEERKPVIDLISTGQAKKVEEAKKILSPAEEEYHNRNKEIDRRYDNHKLVADLINNVKFRRIDEQAVEDYLNIAIDVFQDEFILNCDKLINKLNEMKEYHSNLTKIRRIK